MVLGKRDALGHVASLHLGLLLGLLRLRRLLLRLLLLLRLGHLLLLLRRLLGLLGLLRQLQATADDFDLNIAIAFGTGQRLRHSLRASCATLPEAARRLDTICLTLHLLDRVDALSFARDRHWHLWLRLLQLLLLILLGL